MNKIFRKEVLIGVLVIVACLILFFGINFLKGINLFKAANYFYATYNNVHGLAISAPVTLNGYKVGVVREIKYDYDKPGNVTVEISVDKNLKMPHGSKATVSLDLLGTASVVLTLGKPADGFYAVGDTIESATDAGMLASVSENLMPSVNAIFPKIDTLLTSLNAIAADPALTRSISRLDGITTELEASLASLHKVMGTLQPIAADIKSITTNVDTITGDLTTVSARLREAPVDSLIDNLQATMENLEVLTAKLNNPDGTVGKLTADPALYDNLNATVASLDSLFVDIKKNPKRYINIKLL
ncbi:MAG: MlaD family protein [Muribaculaceae bacterium]|nr:MlaD family protein [Muribaculaceae bacterium]MDE6612425.1 MlaD family protein [Muribaculaceae bacterium]